MKIYDTCVVGAGPCGIACAISLANQGVSVAVVEAGKKYDERTCVVDNGGDCKHCYTCNVISGFGGCVHFGDSAKFSYFPSGKKLHDKLLKVYDRYREEACAFWEIDEKSFADGVFTESGLSFEIKPYPVCVVDSKHIKERICSFYEQLKKGNVEYINFKVVSFQKYNDLFTIELDTGDIITSKNLVLATGRYGREWIKNQIRKNDLHFSQPIPSIGFRFELPKEYLAEIGKIHPDFKVRAQKNDLKYKSFCYCGGDNGGRIKFLNYGDYTLLDGHVLTASDEYSKFGNFALLKQVIVPPDRDYQDYLNEIINKYVKMCGGRPICQSYMEFREQMDPSKRPEMSLSAINKGPVYALFDGNTTDYCNVAEEILAFIATKRGVTLDDLLKEVSVIGLELEGLWDCVCTNDCFMSEVVGLYIGGDCGGETQGILQATVTGIRIADGIIQTVNEHIGEKN